MASPLTWKSSLWVIQLNATPYHHHRTGRCDISAEFRLYKKVILIYRVYGSCFEKTTKIIMSAASANSLKNVPWSGLPLKELLCFLRPVLRFCPWVPGVQRAATSRKSLRRLPCWDVCLSLGNEIHRCKRPLGRKGCCFLRSGLRSFPKEWLGMYVPGGSQVEL